MVTATAPQRQLAIRAGRRSHARRRGAPGKRARAETGPFDGSVRQASRRSA